MEKELANLSLDDEEEEILQAITDPGLETKRVEFCLVGCFLTASVFHFPRMRSTMANLWHPVERVQILELGEKQFFFRFFSYDIHRVPTGFFNGVLERQLGDFLRKYVEYDSFEVVEMGWDLSLRGQSRRALAMNNVWVREGGEEAKKVGF
ncbi:hypothetical protein Godav_017565 [Gossypium davidsonii]|uniref:DUF4283 domain-containing protein n=1 Tax=Gossypium davidsonii TaxID=34287 RepID=A0A7J8QUY3_GOSDV|nr:hypothetical protein [Gossypium davidsonii]